MPHLLTIKKSGGYEIRAALATYMGKEFLDLRTFYPSPDGEMRPTQKGVTVPLHALPDLRDALSAAIRKTSGPRIATVESLMARRALADSDLIDPTDTGGAA